MFRLGAAWGHVDCAYELGAMSADGRGVERSAADAAKYLQIVAEVRKRREISKYIVLIYQEEAYMN